VTGVIELLRVAGLAFVQDGGRPGRMDEGVPPGGALVPAWLARANLALGNDPGEAGIERFGAISFVARTAIEVAEEDGRVCALAPGETIEFGWDGRDRVRYLALRGGMDVPIVLGGRGTLVAAGIGGLEGRPLRRGDRLAVRPPSRPLPSRAPEAPPPEPRGAPIRLYPGPDAARFAPRALEALLEGKWTISRRSDRTGTRLEGPAIPWAPDAPSARTAPMVAGAIELPPAGEPIVLGPDHPTTGGYPVVAVVASADLGRFHARPLGSPVRFERA
jgi:biotin-dependent carboxylase-like uncharacterized protein